MSAGSSVAMRWTIKTEFVQYVMRLPDGRYWLQPPAELDHRAFRYPLTGSFEEGVARWTGEGGVAFAGHGSMLAIAFVQPELTWLPGHGTLSVTDGDDERIVIAELSLLAGTDDAPATFLPSLTAEGAEHFGAYYPQGMPLDSIELLPSGRAS